MDTTFVVTAPTGTADGPPALVCSVAMDTTASLVHLRGELDLATAPVLLVVVDGQLAERHVELSLDLAGLEFCDVRGLDALEEARCRVRGAGGRLTLLRPSSPVRQIAAWVGMSDLFEGGRPPGAAAMPSPPRPGPRP